MANQEQHGEYEDRHSSDQPGVFSARRSATVQQSGRGHLAGMGREWRGEFLFINEARKSNTAEQQSAAESKQPAAGSSEHQQAKPEPPSAHQS